MWLLAVKRNPLRSIFEVGDVAAVTFYFISIARAGGGGVRRAARECLSAFVEHREHCDGVCH